MKSWNIESSSARFAPVRVSDLGLENLASETSYTPGEDFARSICTLMLDVSLLADTGACINEVCGVLCEAAGFLSISSLTGRITTFGCADTERCGIVGRKAGDAASALSTGESWALSKEARDLRDCEIGNAETRGACRWPS